MIIFPWIIIVIFTLTKKYVVKNMFNFFETQHSVLLPSCTPIKADNLN